MRLFAVFYQCLSVMHIVLARSSGVKSKVLATSCNTHNIGLQYMIGCLMIAFSVLPFSVITNQRFPCSFWFQSWSPLTCRNPRGLGPIYTSHLLQSRAWGEKNLQTSPGWKTSGPTTRWPVKLLSWPKIRSIRAILHLRCRKSVVNVSWHTEVVGW